MISLFKEKRLTKMFDEERVKLGQIVRKDGLCDSIYGEYSIVIHNPRFSFVIGIDGGFY